MSILVIAEHDNRVLKPATLNVITAGCEIGGEVHLLVAGSASTAVAEAAAKVDGVARVLHADADHYAEQMPENLAALIVQTVQTVAGAAAYSHVLAAATTAGKNFMPRVAALLDVAQVSEIVAVSSPDVFVRLIYAGSAVLTVESKDPIKVVTVRTTAFTAASKNGGTAVIVPLAPAADFGRSRVIGRDLTQSARPELGAAKIIVAGGRGLGSSANFHALLEPLADKLGAALGASRAAVDAGFVANDLQVGQTGKIVAPQLYIAVGISGAIQHLAGMKDSRVIVAINKDPEAPIFQSADYALVGDLFEIVPRLTAAL